MSASTEDFSLSAWVGTLKVRLGHVEVIDLYNLLFLELQKHTEFLSSPRATSYIFNEGERDEDDEVLSRTLHLEVVSETLRCCIRILPLVGCFDTSLSLSGAALLYSLMQQLCSPARLFDVLSRLSIDSKCSEQQNCSRNVSWRDEQGCRARSELLASKELLDGFSRQDDVVDVIDANSQFEGETQLQMDIFLAILEVYMDEILLCPDLGARFLTFQDESHLMSSAARHTEASVEAAFVHALLSCLQKLLMHGGKTNAPRDEFSVCNLSLPASLLLLETLPAENFPTLCMTHIVQLVARVLDSTTSRDLEEVAGITSSAGPENCSCWSGGVDWSYCLKRLSTKRNTVDWILRPKCLPSLPTIHFASSILEHAMLLYRRFSTSDYLSTGEENGFESNCQTAEKLILRFCVNKYRPLLDVFSNKSELETGNVFTQAEQVETRGRTNEFYEVKGKGSREESSSLVSAVLQLGISSLECITREIGKMLRVSSDALQIPSGHPGSTTFEDYVDRIFEFVSLYLNSFIPSDIQVCTKHNPEQEAGSHLVRDMVSSGQRSLISSVGKAILFFTNVFCGEVQNGASEELLEDYFHLLESFVALLLVVDGSTSSAPPSDEYLTHSLPDSCRNESKTSVGNPSREKGQRDNSSFSWLGAMVLLLQTMLQELSAQQRPLPEFFLDFVLEQISRGDGLNLVAVAFSDSLEQCLDGRDCHQSVVPNGGSFQSKGLVNQILQLALQNPNRTSSFSTLIGYITSMLEDLPPVAATHSLHEVSESVSCYEHIASTFTLACQFAASEQSMVIRNGLECCSWLLSRMCEGIERLFTEGTAVAQWISNWTSSIPAWSPLSKMTSESELSVETQSICETFYSEEGQLQCCSTFLVQIDLLRRAVGAMRSSTEWFLIPESEFTSLFVKARTFLEAFSRLRMMVDKPVRLWRFHIFLQEQLSLHPDDAVDSVEKDWSLDEQKVDSLMDGSKSKNGMSSQGARSSVRGPVPSGRGPCTSKHRAAEQIRQYVNRAAMMGDFAMNLDGDRSSLGFEWRSVKMDSSSEENYLHCQHLLPSSQQDNRRVGEGSTCTCRTDNDETSKGRGGKRIRRSAAFLMSHTSGGGADMPASEVVGAVAPFDSRKRRSYSSSTLAIAKRLIQMRQPLRKRAKTDSRDLMGRYAGGMDQASHLSRKQIHTCVEVEQQRRTDGVAHQDCMRSDVIPNPYLECLRKKELQSWEEGYDDVSDFVVCKKGRDYSKWLEKRQKIRRRLHTRNLFKRQREKRDLVLLLDICA